MKTQFRQSVVYGLLIAAVVAISGCASSPNYYWETEIVEKYRPQINFEKGTVGGNCARVTRLKKKTSVEEWAKGSGDQVVSRRKDREKVGHVECTTRYTSDNSSGRSSKRTSRHWQHWDPVAYALTFSLIQLDDDVFSITAKNEDRDNVDKYTLLVVAENGLHSGFKYARFETSESRDVTREVPLETTTTGRSSSYANTAYGTIYGFGSSNATTTTSGGYTTTDSYGRNHTVKYFNEKVEGAFNLAVMAKSIRRQDSDLDWEVVGLD